ncbi:MAG: LPP20 family lipoprotein [Gammaproteobacteria bacterium]|nr:LPP20 family lipoprotein [Gammaproteobacteria bacterium]
MHSVIKTAGLFTLATLFAACTHYTLPDDPKEKQVAQGKELTSAKEKSPVAVSMQDNASAAAKMAEVNCTADGHYINLNGRKVPSVRVRATGYGAPPKSFYSDPQRRLMAMRAAKVDAYRSLAERIRGVQIWGGTTLGDMVVEKDRFRVYIDTTLQGARVIAENPHEDGSYETTVEVNVDQRLLTATLPNSRDDECTDAANQPKDNAQQAEFIMSSNMPAPASGNSANHIATKNFYYQSE